MSIVSVVKEGNKLVITNDAGEVFRRTIVYEDTVVSVPPAGHDEVGNVYVNSDGDLVIAYNGESLVLGPASDLTTHAADESAHHTKYTNAEAKAAAVKSGAITNGETKAPTHDVVYDVKTVADAAQPAATDAAAAVTAMGAKANDNPLNHDRPDLGTHAALSLSVAVHPNTAMCRFFLDARQEDFPRSKFCRVSCTETNFDPGSNFQTGTWQAGVGDAGSGATTIIDADPTTGSGFVASMRYALVTWDAGASSGYIVTVNSATSLTIIKNKGTNFAPGDTYTILKAHYLVPVSGYYTVFGQVTWWWIDMVALKEYHGGITVNGTVKTNNTVVSAAANKGFTNPYTDVQHFDADDIIAMHVQAASLSDTVDINGEAVGYLTYCAINLVQAD